MKLYCWPVAPNPTKVLIYLAEKGLELELERVNLVKGEHRSEQFAGLNPRKLLPVLELDDGSHLTESLAIIEYLEELSPEPSMWGATPEQRAQARSLERLADGGVLVPIGHQVHATRSPVGYPPNPAVAEYMRGRMEGPLRVLEAALGRHDFVAGDRPTVADCTLYAGLAFGKFFQIEIDPGFAHVAAWFERFGQRPSALAGRRR
ncbi:MAG: glutathione S-transferase family protein [Myxococcales bacterium]|nr:glutathione S-transferase family protein [Myxococcales bacterium]